VDQLGAWTCWPAPWSFSRSKTRRSSSGHELLSLLLMCWRTKPGAAVVDVGVSRDDDGKLVGDVAPDVWEVAGHVSPNPGGVGPLTRAFLLTNVVERAEALAKP